MKTIIKISAVSLCLILVLGVFFACEPPDTGPSQIHYDGSFEISFSYPSPGYTCAIRLTQEKLQSYSGKSIIGIRFYLHDIPESLFLYIYDTGSSTAPGGVQANAIIAVSDLTPNSWNEFYFSSPVPVPASGDIWGAVRITAPENATIFGLDSGPAYANGDYAYVGGWGHVGLDRNLNIRVLVE